MPIQIERGKRETLGPFGISELEQLLESSASPIQGSIELDRKVLAEIAVERPDVFEKIVEEAKK
jgi:hypothetical protein